MRGISLKLPTTTPSSAQTKTTMVEIMQWWTAPQSPHNGDISPRRRIGIGNAVESQAKLSLQDWSKGLVPPLIVGIPHHSRLWRNRINHKGHKERARLGHAGEYVKDDCLNSVPCSGESFNFNHFESLFVFKNG